MLKIEAGTGDNGSRSEIHISVDELSEVRHPKVLTESKRVYRDPCD